MEYYILLKELSVINASAYNNYYIMGMPALTSFNGYFDKIKRVIEETTGESVASVSYSIITHDFHFNSAKERPVPYMVNESNKFKKPPSNKDEYKCNFKASFILNVSFEEKEMLDLDFEENSFSLYDFEDEIQEKIHTLRVAGGAIVNDEDFITITNKEDTLLRELRRVRKGYFISDAQDILNEYIDLFDGDVMKAVVHMCALFRKEDADDNDSRIWERAGEGWMTPTNIGYVQINKEPILNNKGARDDLPLYYVEPLTSMIQYKFSGRILRKMHDSNIIEQLVENKMLFTSKFEDNTYKIIAKGE